MSERVSDELARLWAGSPWEKNGVHNLARDLLDARARIASLEAACQRYFEATSELVTEATFYNDEQEREYADAYNALHDLIHPRPRVHPMSAESRLPDSEFDAFLRAATSARNAQQAIDAAGMGDPHDATIATLQAECARLRVVVEAALSELGVPNEHYPAPVANAVFLLRAALNEKPS